MPDIRIDADNAVLTLSAVHPATIVVFVLRRMHGAGSIISPFMTLTKQEASPRLDRTEPVAEPCAAVSPPRPGDFA